MVSHRDRSLTPPWSVPGGYWFREPTCHGTLAGVVVEAVSPRAFFVVAHSPFPCAPRYGREVHCSLTRAWYRPRGGCACSCELLRFTLWSSLTSSRSCFYPTERFTLEPAETRFDCQMCWNKCTIRSGKRQVFWPGKRVHSAQATNKGTQFIPGLKHESSRI